MQQKTAKCKQCKTKHADIAKMVTTPSALGKFCDYDCLADWVMDNPVKIKQEYSKRVRADKIQFNANDINIRKAAAKTACHLYVRTRDKNKGCISCGVNLFDKNYHAGHLIESGNYPFIRYHEDNIFGQCVYCNLHKGGNEAEAKRGAIERIGEQRVNWLYDNKNKLIKRNIEDYREIERYYKDKLKQINENN